MRKFGLILAGAVLFDLGTVVASSHAAVDMFIKIGDIKGEKVFTVADCTMDGGTVFKRNGKDVCKLPAKAGPSTAAPDKIVKTGPGALTLSKPAGH